MAIKKKAIKKVKDRGVTRSAPIPKPVPRLAPKAVPRPTPPKLKPRSAGASKIASSAPAAKPATTSIPPATGPVWIRVLGHSVRADELAKGCEWYDDGGNEGLKQRPIS